MGTRGRLHIKWYFISWGFRQPINHALQRDTNIWPFQDKSDFQMSCIGYVLKNTSRIYWYRHWCAPRPCFRSPSGLLRLEELVRRFLISRETLSVRMLDDNLDPTPLLKEIRDDKVATIIIDANASVSYLILKKVSSQTSIRSPEPPTHFQESKLLLHTVQAVCLKGVRVYLSFMYPHEGHAELTICKIIKQLARSSTGYTFVVVTELTSIFTFSALQSCIGNNIYACLPATITYILMKVFDKRTSFAGMLPKLVLIHGTACNTDSQHSESWLECVWDVFTGYIWAAARPQRNVLVLAWWCKTVINVCSLHPLPTFLPHTLSPFVPRLLPFLSACPVALLLCPLFAFINPSISSIILPFPHSPLVWSYFLSLSLFVSQASELGMTSAFYKYILTTMVRVRKLFPFPSSVLSSFIFPPSSLLLFLLFLSLYEPAKVLTGRKYSIGGSTERWGKKRERRRRKKRETFEKRITVWRCGCAEEDGGRKRENKVGVWGGGDDRCDVPFFFCHPPPSRSLWCFHPSPWYAPLLFKRLNKCTILCCTSDFYFFTFLSLPSVRDVVLCF